MFSEGIDIKQFAGMPPLQLIELLDESMIMAEELASLVTSSEGLGIAAEMDSAISRCKAQIEEIVPGVATSVPVRPMDGMTDRETRLRHLILCIIRAAETDNMRSQWLLAELTYGFALVAGRLGDVYARVTAESEADEIFS